MVALPATSEKHDNSGDIACHACHHPSQLGTCKDWHILWTMRFSSFIIYTNSATRLTSCQFARPSLAAFLLHLVRSPESLLYDLTSTSVCYIPVDALCQTECEFSLACSLQSFDFRGRVLFAPSSSFKLKNCDSLTKLGPSIYAYNIPVLPGSLQHLQIDQSSENDNMWVNGCDWRCLSGCTNLKRSTEPGKSIRLLGWDSGSSLPGTYVLLSVPIYSYSWVYIYGCIYVYSTVAIYRLEHTCWLLLTKILIQSIK